MTSSILLVDDDPQLVRAILPAFEACGMRVTIANTGRHALSLVEDGIWDALVVDLGLPDMDGIVIVRSAEAKCRIPAIIISSEYSREKIDEAKDAGAYAFLPKPFRTPELIQRVTDSIASDKGRFKTVPE